MVTQRTLLLFNFGLCITLLVSGLLSVYTIETLLPSVGKTIILPALDKKSREQVVNEQDFEQVRAKALYYFDLSVNLKEAHSGQERELLGSVRYVCYLLAAVFAVGGLMVAAARFAPPPPPKPSVGEVLAGKKE
jgi:hypothetical protein